MSTKKFSKAKKRVVLLLISSTVFLLISALVLVSDKEKTYCMGSDKKESCWEDTIEKSINNKGVESTFNLLSEMYERDPDFAASCHGLAHKIGSVSYSLYKSGRQDVFSARAGYCGYGFYHGFMEALIHDTNDMEEAREFCDLAQEKLSALTNDAKGACYHGIGHGLVEDVPAPSAWGKPEEVIKPGLKLCEQVADTDFYLFRCASGVFNAVEILMTKNLYGLSQNYDDPFWLCRSEPYKYAEACYSQFVAPILSIVGEDYARGVSYIDEIEDDRIAIPTMMALVHDKARLEAEDYGSVIKLCRGLSERFRVPCVEAFAQGLLKYGPPVNEYTAALNFCGFDALSEVESSQCFDTVVLMARTMYPEEKSREICESIDEKYLSVKCKQ